MEGVPGRAKSTCKDPRQKSAAFEELKEIPYKGSKQSLISPCRSLKNVDCILRAVGICWKAEGGFSHDQLHLRRLPFTATWEWVRGGKDWVGRETN